MSEACLFRVVAWRFALWCLVLPAAVVGRRGGRPVVLSVTPGHAATPSHAAAGPPRAAADAEAGAAATAAAAAPVHEFRPFALPSAHAAGQILKDGGLGADVIGELRHRELAVAAAEVIGGAVLRIRESLLEAGLAPEQAPVFDDSGRYRLKAPALRRLRQRPGCTLGRPHPRVWRLAVAGGPCAGKTSGMAALVGSLRERGRGRYEVFTVPEVATLLFHLGVASCGTFRNCRPAEYRAFGVQMTCLQVALEEIWAAGAEEALRRTPGAERAVLVADRDAVNFKCFSRPVDPQKPAAWPEVLRSAGELLGAPGVTERELAERYELGVVVLQTYAVLRGELNHAGYDSKCVGSGSTNSVRKETAEEARANDEYVRAAYAEAYPATQVCLVENDGEGIDAKMDAAVGCAWKRVERLESGAGRA